MRGYHHWTRAECLSSARAFSFLAEWKRCDPNAYMAANYHGWKEVGVHLKRGPSSVRYCVYCLVYPDGLYIGMTRDLKVRLSCHRRLRGGFRAITLSTDLSVDEAASLETTLIKVLAPKYNKRGGGSVGSFVRRHTLEACKREALKYNTRSIWKNHGSKTYKAAQHNRWLPLCCGHMKTLRKVRTFEECLASRRCYPTQNSWKYGDTKSYGYANVHGWLWKIAWVTRHRSHCILGCGVAIVPARQVIHVPPSTTTPAMPNRKVGFELTH
jgi:hypothetical protein